MKLDARLLKRLHGAGRPFLLSVLAGLASVLCTVLLSFALSRLITLAFISHRSLSDLRPWMLLFIAGAILRALFVWLSQSAGATVGARMKSSMRDDLLESVDRVGPGSLDSEHSGELAATLGRGIDSLDAWYSQFLPQVILALFAPLLILCFVFPSDWISGLIMLVTAPLIPFFMALISATTERVTRKQWKDLSRMSAHFLDVLQGLTTLKLLGRSREQAERIAAVSEAYRHSTMGVLRVAFLSSLTLELLATVSTAVIAVSIGIRLLYGRMEFEPGLFVLILTAEFYLPLRLLGARFHTGTESAIAGKRMLDVLEKQTRSGGIQKAESARGMGSGLRLDGVTFSYPGTSKPALDRVTLEFPRQKLSAIVGSSGSGKSTLFKLLLKFHSPDAGFILCDGQNLADLPDETWRRRLAWVPQKPYLFCDTITNNIRLGRPDASDDQVRLAARQARLHSFIESLPHGYETIIGERGSKLSAGQAQRMALARAFLIEADWLLLDEPTSALDPESEADIQQSMAELLQGRSAIVIAHRMATVRNADHVVVLENGRVVEEGAPAALLAGRGALSRYWHASHESEGSS